MTIYERIRELRLSRGMSQYELAKKVGYEGRSAISKVENGGRDISQSMIQKYADALGVTPTYLLYGDEHDTQDREAHYPGVYHPVMRRVPLLGKVACGKPIYSPNYDDGFALINSDVIADFALEAKGDSMSGANICEGDVVFFAEAEQVDNGQIAAVFVDNEVTLKRVYYYPEQNKLMLAAENPKYPPMVYTNEELNDIRIIGRAVAYQHIIKS